MINLKTLYLSFLLSGLFINCSSAQDKSLPTQPSEITIKANRFESTEGGFTIDIFQVPIYTQNLEAEIPNKKDKGVGKMFVWKSGKILYTVLYNDSLDFSGSATSQNLEDFNKGVRKTVARNQGKIVSEKPISLDKYRGTEIRYIFPNGIKFICRNYLVDKRGYGVSAGYTNDMDEKEVLEVLDSFKLLINKNVN